MIKIDWPAWTEQAVFNTTVHHITMSGLKAVVLWGVITLAFLVAKKVLSRLSRMKVPGSVVLVNDVIDRINQKLFFVIAIGFFLSQFQLPEKLNLAINVIVASLVLLQVFALLDPLINTFVSSIMGANGDHQGRNVSLRRNLIFIMKSFIWVSGFLFLFNNFGLNVSTLLAGLGVGGLAVALALQTVLGDAFSSFAIGIDKPFEVGDFVVFDQNKGTVETIGLKTTRIRSLSGEIIVVPNSDLTKAQIRNFKRMEQRRIVFSFGVVYETPVEKVEMISNIVRKIFDEHQIARLDRCHFLSFGDFALIFEVVYFVESPEYNVYMDIQQSVNLSLMKTFEKEGIVFAYPTQTVYLRPEPSSEGPASKLV